MSQVILTRKATTTGGRDGKVHNTLSGVELVLSKPQEMGGQNTQVTNPEELFSMGYSSCFASSLEFIMAQQDISYETLAVDTKTALVSEDGKSFKFALEVKVTLEGVSAKEKASLIEAAYQFCPYSKAIQGNVDVTFID